MTRTERVLDWRDEAEEAGEIGGIRVLHINCPSVAFSVVERTSNAKGAAINFTNRLHARSFVIYTRSSGANKRDTAENWCLRLYYVLYNFARLSKRSERQVCRAKLIIRHIRRITRSLIAILRRYYRRHYHKIKDYVNCLSLSQS